jgi:hypothetical protein
MAFFLKIVKISIFSFCNYYLCANTCSTLIQIVSVPRVCYIHLDQRRIGVCIQRIITTLGSTIFNHFKNKQHIMVLPILYCIYVHNYNKNL